MDGVGEGEGERQMKIYFIFFFLEDATNADCILHSKFERLLCNMFKIVIETYSVYYIPICL